VTIRWLAAAAIVSFWWQETAAAVVDVVMVAERGGGDSQLAIDYRRGCGALALSRQNMNFSITKFIY